MPKTLTVGLALVVMIGACRPSPSELTEGDRTAIRQVVADVTSTLLAGDYATWAGLFAENAVIYSPNAPAVRGRDALQSWVGGFPPIQELEFFDVEKWGQGDYAFALSAYRFAVEGGPLDTGKQLWVLRRSEASRWEVMALSYSSDLPVPMPQD
jgi:ketosteroid isomerase-like protein